MLEGLFRGSLGRHLRLMSSITVFLLRPPLRPDDLVPRALGERTQIAFLLTDD